MLLNPKTLKFEPVKACAGIIGNSGKDCCGVIGSNGNGFDPPPMPIEIAIENQYTFRKAFNNYLGFDSGLPATRLRFTEDEIVNAAIGSQGARNIQTVAEATNTVPIQQGYFTEQANKVKQDFQQQLNNQPKPPPPPAPNAVAAERPAIPTNPPPARQPPGLPTTPVPVRKPPPAPPGAGPVAMDVDQQPQQPVAVAVSNNNNQPPQPPPAVSKGPPPLPPKKVPVPVTVPAAAPQPPPEAPPVARERTFAEAIEQGGVGPPPPGAPSRVLTPDEEYERIAHHLSNDTRNFLRSHVTGNGLPEIDALEIASQFAIPLDKAKEIRKLYQSRQTDVKVWESDPSALKIQEIVKKFRNTISSEQQDQYDTEAYKLKLNRPDLYNIATQSPETPTLPKEVPVAAPVQPQAPVTVQPPPVEVQPEQPQGSNKRGRPTPFRTERPAVKFRAPPNTTLTSQVDEMEGEYQTMINKLELELEAAKGAVEPAVRERLKAMQKEADEFKGKLLDQHRIELEQRDQQLAQLRAEMQQKELERTQSHGTQLQQKDQEMAVLKSTIEAIRNQQAQTLLDLRNENAKIQEEARNLIAQREQAYNEGNKKLQTELTGRIAELELNISKIQQTAAAEVENAQRLFGEERTTSLALAEQVKKQAETANQYIESQVRQVEGQYQGKIANLEAIIKNFDSTIGSLEQKNRTLEQQLSQTNVDSAKYADIYNKWQANEERISNLEKQKQALENQTGNALYNQRQELETQLNNFNQQRLKDMEELKKQHALELSGANAKLIEATSQHSKLKSSISKMEKEIQSKAKSIINLKQELADSKAALENIRGLAEKGEASEKELAKLKKQYEHNKVAYQVATSTSDAAKKEVEELKKTLKHNEVQINRLKQNEIPADREAVYQDIWRNPFNPVKPTQPTQSSVVNETLKEVSVPEPVPLPVKSKRKTTPVINRELGNTELTFTNSVIEGRKKVVPVTEQRKVEKEVLNLSAIMAKIPKENPEEQRAVAAKIASLESKLQEWREKPRVTLPEIQARPIEHMEEVLDTSKNKRKTLTQITRAEQVIDRSNLKPEIKEIIQAALQEREEHLRNEKTSKVIESISYPAVEELSRPPTDAEILLMEKRAKRSRGGGHNIESIRTKLSHINPEEVFAEARGEHRRRKIGV
jgi:hypothetical protein